MFFATADDLRFFAPSSPPARHIHVIDLRNASLDDALTATTLQGVVNRGEQAQLYLVFAPCDLFWLERMTEDGQIQQQESVTLQQALEKFEDHIRTIIVYDPDLPASINLATMIASLEEGIVCASTASFPKLCKPVQELRARWKTNAEAYQWAFDHVFSKMNPNMLACYHPTACRHHLRDYLVRNKVFHFWATSQEKEDGIRSDYAEERAVVETIFKASPANTPVLGFWYSGLDKGLDEYDGVGLAGEYGKITVVCDWASNLSLLGGVPAQLDQAILQHQQKLNGKETVPLQKDKIYLCVNVVESGDSPSYMQTRQYEVWQDPQRGAIPINWSLGPTLLDLAPGIAAYYYRTAAANDYFYTSISGAGYCHPYRGLFSKTSHPDQAWDNYLQRTNAYMQRMHCTALGLYTDAWKPFRQETMNPTTQRFVDALPQLDALVLGMGRDDNISNDAGNYYIGASGKTLASHIMTRWPTDYAARSREENIDWLVRDILEHSPQKRPGFMQVMALSWAYGPSEIQEVCANLGNDYIPVIIPEYVRLYQEAIKNDNYQQ